MSTQPTSSGTDARPSEHGLRFWVGVVLGGAVMVYGAVGLVRNIEGDELVSWFVYFVGTDVVHDALVAPALLAAGAIAARFLPAPLRAPVTIGCIVSGAVLLVGAVPLLDLGGNPLNPTIRPLDYSTAVLTALGIVWLVVALVALASAVVPRVRGSDRETQTSGS